MIVSLNAFGNWQRFHRRITGVIDTCDECVAGVVDTGDACIAGISDTGKECITSVNDTSEVHSDNSHPFTTISYNNDVQI
jgi:hypothetical protein